MGFGGCLEYISPAQRLTAVDGPLYWIWGTDVKSPPARAAAERLLGHPAGTFSESFRRYRQGQAPRPLANLPPDAVERLRRLRRTAPQSPMFFGANSLREMAGGLVTRTREHGRRASGLVLEDHGIAGGTPPRTLLFFGREAITLSNLSQHRRSFEMMREGLAPGAEVFFVHCYAADDGCRLVGEIGRILGAVVWAATGIQLTRSGAMENESYRVENGRPRRATFPREVLYLE